MRNDKGMTLVEIIVSLVVIAVIGSLVVQYTSSVMGRSGDSVSTIRNMSNVNSVLERIIIDYKELKEVGATSLDSFKNKIGNESTPQDNSYGAYDVIQNRYIEFDGSNSEVAATSDITVLKIRIRVGNQWVTSIFSI